MDIKLLKRTQKNPQCTRKEGYVPVAVYGKGIRHGDLMVAEDVILQYLRSIGEEYSSTLINIVIDGVVHQSIIKSIDEDCTTSKIVHMDFNVINLKDKFTSHVPIRVINENLCTDLKSGKTALIVPIKSIKIHNSVDNLIKNITVDVSKLHKGKIIDMSNGNIKFDGSKFVDINTQEVIYLSPKHIKSFKLTGQNLKEVRIPAYNVIHSYEFPHIKFVNKKHFPIVSIK